MIKIAQVESVWDVYTHTNSSLTESVVRNNTTFICGVQNKSMCNGVNYNIII